MSEATGPVMIVATDILRAPRARVGKLFGNVTLPRSVELRTVGAAFAGAFLGALLWLMPLGVLAGYSGQSFLYVVTAGGALGVSTLYIQPLKGEPLWKWALLTFQEGGRRRREGRLHIGVQPLGREAAGRVLIRNGCVNVTAGNFDERGAPRRVGNFVRNLPDSQVAQQGFKPSRTLR